MNLQWEGEHDIQVFTFLLFLSVISSGRVYQIEIVSNLAKFKKPYFPFKSKNVKNNFDARL